MGIPDAKGRQMILEVMCKSYNFDRDIDFSTLAKLTPGFVGSDLKALVTAAASSAEDRHFSQTKEMYLQEKITPKVDLPELFE